MEWEKREEWERELIAFLVAPLMVPLAAILFLGALPIGIIGVFIFSGAIMGAYTSMLLIGVPLYLLVRKLNATAFVVAPISGAVIGASTMWLLCFAVGFPALQAAAEFGGFTGAAVGAVFWAIARPDLPPQGRGAQQAQ